MAERSRKVPEGLSDADTHEWLRAEADGTVTIGITDHAQAALGDLVYVDLPAPGRTVAAGEACAVVESVKAASDVYAPIAGEIVASNASLSGSPEAVNEDAYAAWLFRLRPADASALSAFMDADAYKRLIADA
jgi:glycine cleavage system H protein